MKFVTTQSYDDLDQALKLIKWFTRISVINIFHEEEGHKLKKLLFHFVAVSFMVLVVICSVAGVYYCWDDYLKFIESIITALACCRIVFEWFILVGNYDKIREIITGCQKFRSKYTENIKNENAEISHHIFIKCPTLIVRIFLSNVIACCTFLTVVPIFKSERAVPLLLYLPIGPPLETPYFELNYIWCMLSIPFLAGTIIGIDSIFIILVSEVCLQLHVMKYQLSFLGNEQENDAHSVLREIQRIHCDIIRTVRCINEAFSKVLAVEFTTTLLMLSIALFMVMNNNFTFIVWIIFFIMQLGFYCLLGEVLKDKFEKAFFALYNNQFYNLNVKLRKSLVLMMTCSQKTPTLTAGSLAELSLMNYFQILKKAFSFFTVMRDNQYKE